VKLTFHNAGHILGSSVTHFHIGDGLYNVAFSGDIHSRGDTRLFNGAVNDFPRVETLVLESTYGGRNDYQTDQADSEEALKEVINDDVRPGREGRHPCVRRGAVSGDHARLGGGDAERRYPGDAGPSTG